MSRAVQSYLRAGEPRKIYLWPCRGRMWAIEILANSVSNQHVNLKSSRLFHFLDTCIWKVIYMYFHWFAGFSWQRTTFSANFIISWPKCMMYMYAAKWQPQSAFIKTRSHNELLYDFWFWMKKNQKIYWQQLPLNNRQRHAITMVAVLIFLHVVWWLPCI
mgnify:CR=1 FL=1